MLTLNGMERLGEWANNALTKYGYPHDLFHDMVADLPFVADVKSVYSDKFAIRKGVPAAIGFVWFRTTDSGRVFEVRVNDSLTPVRKRHAAVFLVGLAVALWKTKSGNEGVSYVVSEKAMYVPDGALEEFASAFAFEYLMPKADFVQECERHKDEKRFIDTWLLQQKYGVSSTAVGYRIVGRGMEL